MTKRPRSRELWADHLTRRLQDAPVGKQPAEHYHKRTPSQLEHDIQVSFITQVDLMIPQTPELATLYAIPNGGHRHPAVGAKMKREGVRRGVPDLHLPVPRGSWASLYLETKVPGRKPSKYQRDRFELLRSVGNVVVVCYSADDLINTVNAYLNGEIKDEQGGTVAAARR